MSQTKISNPYIFAKWLSKPFYISNLELFNQTELILKYRRLGITKSEKLWQGLYFTFLFEFKLEVFFFDSLCKLFFIFVAFVHNMNMFPYVKWMFIWSWYFCFCWILTQFFPFLLISCFLSFLILLLLFLLNVLWKFIFSPQPRSLSWLLYLSNIRAFFLFTFPFLSLLHVTQIL